MYIKGKPRGEHLLPLERVTLVCEQIGIISVKDGLGREYLRRMAEPELMFLVAGALGTQSITLEDEQGQVLDRLLPTVSAQTSLSDEGGQFSELLQILLYTMLTQSNPDWPISPTCATRAASIASLCSGCVIMSTCSKG